MLHRIVVPLDGEPFAEAALVPACELARTFGSQLLLVRVGPGVGPGTGPSLKSPVAPGTSAAAFAPVAREVEVESRESRDAADAVDAADAYLQAIGRELRAAGYAAELLLASSGARSAEPGAAIADAARTQSADLLVMAAHTRWAVQPMSLPSTTVAVLAHASVPVLAWHPPSVPGRMHRTSPSTGATGPHLAQPETPLIVPLDGSLRAESALPLAEALAAAFGTYLVLVHARAPSPSPSTAGAQPVARRAADVARALEDAAEAAQYLDVVRGEILARGGHATTVVRVGQPFAVIERCWREFGASLIIMASRGQSQPKPEPKPAPQPHRNVLGSVARRLVEELEAPVLVIPPEREILKPPATRDVIESSTTASGA